jgi:Zn ribbon nucleic-acid-binding protein
MRGVYSVNKGENNPLWKGDKASKQAGRSRARYLFKNRPCEKCGSIKIERHHKDGNTLNNRLKNIEFVCRKCHMAEDGRLEFITNYTKINGQKNNAGWIICPTCKNKYRDKMNREFIINISECARCDHLRTERSKV